MGEPIGQYFKFMSDIIDSGTWARLSSGARTLYPVLLKFSDQNFKKVWPSTSTLMKLTGFKNKRSIIDAKRDLVEAGLIHIIPGKGHKNSVYSFTFCYEREVQFNAPQRSTIPALPGGAEHTERGHYGSPQGTVTAAPNNINITIQNTQNQKENNRSIMSPETLNSKYSKELLAAAYRKAEGLGLSNDLSVIDAFCRDLSSEMVKNNHNYARESWRFFLAWASSNLTEKSKNQLACLDVAFMDDEVILSGLDSEFIETIIRKYYDEKYSNILLKIIKTDSSSKSRLY